MVKAGDKLIMAGPPDLKKKTQGILAYENEAEVFASFKGEKGAVLRVLNADDGETVSEQALPAIPVFDGMSAAGGKVFIALKNGEVLCWK